MDLTDMQHTLVLTTDLNTALTTTKPIKKKSVMLIKIHPCSTIDFINISDESPILKLLQCINQSTHLDEFSDLACSELL